MIVIADADPIAQVNMRDMEEMKRVVEERMSAIAHTLGIHVEGKIEELRILICEMLEQEKGQKKIVEIHKRSKKTNGSGELKNLTLSINYKKRGGEKKEGDKSGSK